MILIGKGGKQYNLEPAPFAQGGEGEIYNVIGQPQIVAKLYKPGKITSDHERKLITMMSSPPSANVMTQIAWPQDVLYKQSVFVGFIMQKFKLNEDLNVIYEYGSAAKYPDMPWGNKINIAKNICVVVDEVHNSGHTIGDFNPRNINVDPSNGLIVFVDTDSYHITEGNQIYRCNVGLPEYLASEIQKKLSKGVSLSSCSLPTFTQETDRFALAIHIFQLLMNGVHPFACAVLPSQSSVAFPQPTDNILNGQCAFLQNVPGITIPSYAPSIDILPKYMKDLFKRAFIDGYTDPLARPSAEEWYNALDKLQRSIKKCSTVSFHEYESSLMACPWCATNAKFSRSTSKGTTQTTRGYTPGSAPRPPQPPKPPAPPTTGYPTSTGTVNNNAKPKKKKKGCGCFVAILIFLVVVGVAVASSWDYIMNTLEDYGVIDGGFVQKDEELTGITLITNKNTVAFGDTIHLSFSPTPSSPDKYNNEYYDPDCIEYFVRINGTDYRIENDGTEVDYVVNQLAEKIYFWAKYCNHYTHNDTDGDIVSDLKEVVVEKIKISSASDLAKLNNSNLMYELTNDIDLNNVEWTPIQNFSGVLDGNGYEISGLKITKQKINNIGLFATLNGRVSNIKITNVEINVSGGYENVGIICGTNVGIIDEVYASGKIVASSCTNVGGLIGYNTGTVENCTNATNVKGSHNVGGVIGYYLVKPDTDYGDVKYATISGMKNEGTIEGLSYIGGIIGKVFVNADNRTIEVSVCECHNNAMVSGVTENTGGVIGGIDKYTYFSSASCSITSSSNTANVVGGDYVGGLIGRNDAFSGATYCNNSGEITGDKFTGGVLGCANGKGDILSCTNTGVVSGGDYTGGILAYGTSVVSISKSKNSADITGGNYVGGYIGSSNGTAVDGLTNENKITGKAYLGGVAGLAGIVTDCTNKGEIISTGFCVEGSLNLARVGGVVGYANGVQNCKNTADVIVTSVANDVGGVVGCCYANYSTVISSNVNEGTVSGYLGVGGIIGYLIVDADNHDTTVSVSECYNYGSVTGTAYCVGGIVGGTKHHRYFATASCSFSSCNNSGDITGNDYVCGIVGRTTDCTTSDERIWNTNVNSGKISCNTANTDDKFQFGVDP